MAINPAWMKAHRTEVLLGGGGIVVTIALYMRSKSSAGGTNAANQSYANPATAVDTTQASMYDSLANQIGGLGQSVAALTAAHQAGTYVAPTNETLFGAGYGAPGQATEYASSTTPVAGMQGGSYYSQNDQQIWNDVSSGAPIYNQVAPGDFQITKNVNAGPVFIGAPGG